MNSAVESTKGVVVYPKATCIIAVVCAVLFTILGVFGNGTGVFALLKSRNLRKSTTTYFVVSLSITDLIFCSFNLPLTASRYAHQAWILGDVLCEIFPFIFYLNVAASLFHMMAISINRYVLIAHYRIYDKIFSPIRSLIIIAFCWIVPLVLLTPTLAGAWGEFGYKNHTFSCTILKVDGKSPKKFLFLFGILVPCLVIAAAYSGIFWAVRKTAKNLANQSSALRPQRKAEELSLTKMLLTVFGAFLACYIPLMLANSLDKNEDKFPTLHVLASILAWSSSVINPFVYVAMNRRYRKAFVALFCTGGHTQPSTASGNSSTRLSLATTSLNNVNSYCVGYTRKPETEYDV